MDDLPSLLIPIGTVAAPPDPTVPMPPKKSLTAKPVSNLFSSALDAQSIYCGDNLKVLRELPDAFVDLIYIDPPFNSDRNYETFWGETKEKRTFDDRHGSTKAYIDFMRPRCVELARVLKKTGSFYFHCDWHASHYVKVMLDQIFGENNFINEVIWKRSTAHNDARQGSKHFGRIHDTVLLYSGGSDHTWNHVYTGLSEEYVRSHYRHKDSRGLFRWDNLTGPGGASKGNPFYEVLGVKGYWRYKRERMEQLIADGLVAIPPKGTKPSLKRYLKDSKGVSLQSVWDDLPPVNSQAKEAIGYPTQKPLPLLERMTSVSSNADDLVLDAFCGCGTALVAAQQLGRRWIGIDVSPTACRVMSERLEKVCKLKEGTDFVVTGLPFEEDTLRKMPPFEFQNWAVVALGGVSNKRKTGDMGIDGKIYPVDAIDDDVRRKPDQLDFMDHWYPVQVKQRDSVGRPDIDAFETVLRREKRTRGYFVAFDYTSGAKKEIDRFLRDEKRAIIPLTVKQILDEEQEVLRAMT
ncbi:DNA methyltransferase [Limnoglobus roseus]|uniref:DNA methyltransferase n=1 Tax=Limnoglobus roseus TaxID=2598579 RepID=UPI0011EA81C0|nr:DNA methyltransferase [Limnoglobus roseus]